jgi:GT2 family glycosyltransferase
MPAREPAAPPEISVVIASLNGLPYPLGCLRALEDQVGGVSCEVIVADCSGPSTVAAIRELFPRVRVLEFNGPRSVPWLRARGFEAATGSLVAVTEDHCVPAPTWLRAMRETVKTSGWAAVGGGVTNGSTRRLTDWAVYFCEYSGLIDPVPAGESERLPGMNTVYDMEQLAPIREVFLAGYWENVIHDHIRDAGYIVGLDPAIVVAHSKWFTIPMFFSERYHYSRAFAGHRVEGQGWSARITWALKSLALPPVLITRIIRDVRSRRRHRAQLLAAFPLVVFFSVVWAIGELVGYLTGPGDSILRIR